MFFDIDLRRYTNQFGTDITMDGIDTTTGEIQIYTKLNTYSSEYNSRDN